MTKELWFEVWQNLIMGFAFLLPFFLCRIADVLFGVITVFKIEDARFDRGKFIKGVITTVISSIALACLIAGISMIPELLAYYKVDLVNTDILADVVDMALILSTIIIAAFSYGRDAYEKFKLILVPTKDED